MGIDNSILKIKEKTDNFPVDTNTLLNTIAAYIDTEVAAILANTTLPSVNSVNNITLADVIGNKNDDESGTSLYSGIYILGKHNHSRQRSYPTTATGIILTANSGAGVFGNIVEVIPTTANDVNTLTITHACDVAGNITIDLNGEKFTKAINTGNINSVASQLRAMSFDPVEGGAWAISGAGADVIFTRSGFASTGVLSNLGSTGITGSFAKTATGAGVQMPFDIHALQLGTLSNAATWVVRLYKGAANYEEVICTMRYVSTASATAGGTNQVHTPVMPAGTRISAAVATVAGGASRTAVISVNYHMY